MFRTASVAPASRSAFRAGSGRRRTSASPGSGASSITSPSMASKTRTTTLTATLYLPSITFLQEFKVQSGVYPAEFGRATSQVNVSTKSGTNSYHGALFEFFRNSKLDALDYAFTSAPVLKNPFVRNQYGFVLV